MRADQMKVSQSGIELTLSGPNAIGACKVMRALYGLVMLLVIFGCRDANAQKQIVTYAYTGDASYAPFLHALRSGKVSSPMVEVRVMEAPIPALIQAMGTKQYDLIENTVLGVPVALSRGVDGIIVGSGGIVRGGRYLMVRKDASFKSPIDLKDKVVGTNGLASTAAAHLRFVLAKKYGLNVALQNGSYQWVDLPLASLPVALSRINFQALLSTSLLVSRRSSRVNFDPSSTYTKIIADCLRWIR